VFKLRATGQEQPPAPAAAPSLPSESEPEEQPAIEKESVLAANEGSPVFPSPEREASGGDLAPQAPQEEDPFGLAARRDAWPASDQDAEPVPVDEEPRPSVRTRPSDSVKLRGVDLNLATAAELSQRLDGVGPKLAARIVKYRELCGRFGAVSDLAHVPGVGPSTYEKMTGTSWSEARDSLRRTLDYLMGRDEQGAPDLQGLAERLSALPGFEGCLFTHEEGHLLAAHWDHGQRDVLAAVAPQILKRLVPYVQQLDLGEANPVTLFLGNRAVTLLQSAHVIMATIHRSDRFGRRQGRLLELIGSELEESMDLGGGPPDAGPAADHA
jgi:competence ComEA-like helix-hairpin-helix protein